MFEISLCITTFNRYDTFLKKNLPKFLESPYISEIVIVDDASDDYVKLINEYGINHPIIKIYKQPYNVGGFKNKIYTTSLATKEWICLLDSDNYIDERYFKPLFEEWHKNGIHRDYIYTASKALPLFILNNENIKVIGKDEWNRLMPPKDWFINLGNFVFHKTLVPFLNHKDYATIHPYGLCSSMINWIGVKNNFKIKFVENMTYDHAIHPNNNESYYLATTQQSGNFSNNFNWFV